MAASFRQLARPVTVRRTLDGKIGLFVGDDPLEGVVALDVMSNAEDCGVYVQFDPQYVHFDTEAVDHRKVN